MDLVFPSLESETKPGVGQPRLVLEQDKNGDFRVIKRTDSYSLAPTDGS